jgi:hypothetical protein
LHADLQQCRQVTENGGVSMTPNIRWRRRKKMKKIKKAEKKISAFDNHEVMTTAK